MSAFRCDYFAVVAEGSVLEAPAKDVTLQKLFPLRICTRDSLTAAHADARGFLEQESFFRLLMLLCVCVEVNLRQYTFQSILNICKLLFTGYFRGGSCCGINEPRYQV